MRVGKDFAAICVQLVRLSPNANRIAYKTPV